MQSLVSALYLAQDGYRVCTLVYNFQSLLENG